MTRRARPTLIGLFVIGGLALVVGALLVLGGRQWFARRVPCVMAFDGSVAGLAVGSPVSFRGVPVGAVSGIEFRYGSNLIVVFVQLDPSRVRGAPRDIARARQAIEEDVEKGLRAQLQLQSLVTGQLSVGLDYHPGAPGTLTGVEKDSCEIPTVPTALAQAQEHLMKIAAQLADAPLKQVVEGTVRTLDGVERLVTSPELRRTLASADRTMSGADLLVSDLRARVGPAVGSLERTLDQAQRTIEEVGRDVRRLVADIDVRVGPLATSIGATSDSTRALMEDAGRAVRRLDEKLGPTLDQAQRTIEEVGRDVRRLIADIDGRVGPLATSIGATSDSTRALMEDAGRAVRRLDEKLGPTLDQAQRTIEEVGRDVRRLVADIDGQVGPLAASIGATSDSTRALMEDAGRAVRRLDEQIDPALAGFRRATDATSDAMRKAETTFGQVDGAFDGSSPLGYQLADALEQLTRAAASLRVLSEDIQRQPNVLLFGRGGAKTR